MTTGSPLPFQKIIDELLDGQKPLSRRSLQNFSDIDPDSLKALLEASPRIRADRKRLLLGELETMADHDTLVSFDDVARALLSDFDSKVVSGAIRLLKECDDLKLVPAYLKIMSNDEDAHTRSEAAAALGKFVWLGELEEIPIQIHRQVEDALFEKADSDDQAGVRRRALESLGYSSRSEAAALIESAFQRADPDWQASAVLAMGRSSDSERWEDEVLSKMLDDQPRLQLAAVKAAGELGLKSAGSILLNILEDEEDDEITSAAIWSLSQIGGEDARVYIENLIDQTEDEDLISFLEEALSNLSFNEDLNQFDLMSYDPDEEE